MSKEEKKRANFSPQDAIFFKFLLENDFGAKDSHKIFTAAASEYPDTTVNHFKKRFNDHCPNIDVANWTLSQKLEFAAAKGLSSSEKFLKDKAAKKEKVPSFEKRIDDVMTGLRGLLIDLAKNKE